MISGLYLLLMSPDLDSLIPKNIYIPLYNSARQEIGTHFLRANNEMSRKHTILETVMK